MGVTSRVRRSALLSRPAKVGLPESVRQNFLHAFDDAQALIDCADVDLVAVIVPAPEHARLVRAAIAAGARQ
jgi:predicted dehydrogenase